MSPAAPSKAKTPPALPGYDDVQMAAVRIAGKALRTPIIDNPALNDLVGGRVLIKPECLQRTGSFKFRGAFNRISQLGLESREGGVVAYSSGNHAQGVAAAAQLKDLPAVIVMPEDTPEIKVSNTAGYGAEVVQYDRGSEDREAIAKDLAKKRGAVIVPPYDDANIIAGQGTAGLEFAQDLTARGVSPDALLVPAGGGGLLAGTSLAFEGMFPETEVYSVEPEDFDDHLRSLKSGKRRKNKQTTGSVCDALLSAQPGKMTFAINQPRATGGLAVSDDEVRLAVAYAFRTLKLVVEPGGAVCLAAILAGKIDCRDRNIAIVLSGGNVDPGLFSEIVNAH